ncbi:hypothetical protein [Hydrogenophaga sp.]|uniref:hypothetical protein n=1 Tax=Hydrogenophaga sp. TaxID=1904254 RepID=UPI0019AB1F6E|nr:hypothetical protein [Hydrogenophaga sp.]MBD3893140.1 hypothetical protein [Hydrogenophaga sp.]
MVTLSFRRTSAVASGCMVCLGLLLTTGFAALAQAQGFGAFITPPRFELVLNAGQTSRQVMEIQHVGAQSGRFRIYSNDWRFNDDESIHFQDELAADSCRPWVALERRELSIAPGERFRFRFEITVPPGTPARECRFALMVEGMEPVQVQGAISFPVGGRIAVIVYAAIGGAEPKLSLSASRVQLVNGQPGAVLEVHNSGNAHGRLAGFVNGTDASGARFELAPADAPILPGQTRHIALLPLTQEGQPTAEIRFPLTVKGHLEWGRQRLPLDLTFTP